MHTLANAISKRCLEAGYNLVSIIFDDWTADEFEYLQDTCTSAIAKRKEQMETTKSIKVLLGE